MIRRLAFVTLAVLPGAATFLQPTTSNAYREYLLGRWDRRKKTQYKTGGLDGIFVGSACFRVLDGADPKLLCYEEDGNFTADVESFGTRETRIRLLYDFSDWSEVKVLQDNAIDRSSIEEIVSQARPLYTLEMDATYAGTMRSARGGDGIGSTGSEVFEGLMEVSAADSFLSTWNVQGPEQSGTIISLFKRQELITTTTLRLDPDDLRPPG